MRIADVVMFVLFFLIPGGLIFIYAPRMLRQSARSPLWVYKSKPGTVHLVVLRATMAGWILLGFAQFILHRTG